MTRRAIEDRRIKKIKVSKNSRTQKRRDEDLANIRSYYLVLGLSIGFFLFIAIISFVWGR